MSFEDISDIVEIEISKLKVSLGIFKVINVDVFMGNS